MSNSTLREQIQAFIEISNEAELDTKILIGANNTVNEQIWRRIEFHTSEPNPEEWVSLCVGRMGPYKDNQDEYTLLYIEDFFTIPTIRDRSGFIHYPNENFLKIADRYMPLLMIYTKTEGTLEFSVHDIENARKIDFLLQRPILHMLVNQNKQSVIKIFNECSQCVQNPFHNAMT